MTEAWPAGDRPIGVFDSGVGGLSVVRHLREQLPQEDLLYFADQAHLPYGGRSGAEIVHYSSEITRFLLVHGAKVIVVACNTATAAAIDTLRVDFSDTLFVGMEPALKPAAMHTAVGKIGVLATPGTFASSRYAMLIDRFAAQVEVYEDPCRGLVAQIEAGELLSAETARILTSATAPMLAAGVDTLVLGCTHYPFVLPLLRSIVGHDVTIIDPAPAVARHAGHVLQHHELSAGHKQPGTLTCFSSGEPSRFAELAGRLLEEKCLVTPTEWEAGELTDTTTSFRPT